MAATWAQQHLPMTILGTAAAAIIILAVAVVAILAVAGPAHTGRHGDTAPTQRGPGRHRPGQRTAAAVGAAVRARPAPPYDWARDDPTIASCGLCAGTGWADWTDPLTGSGIVLACPCGALPPAAGA